MVEVHGGAALPGELVDAADSTVKGKGSELPIREGSHVSRCVEGTQSLAAAVENRQPHPTE